MVKSPPRKLTIASVRFVFRTILWPRRKLLLIGLGLIAVNRLCALVLPGSTRVLIDDVVGAGKESLLVPLAAVVGGSVAVQADKHAAFAAEPRKELLFDDQPQPLFGLMDEQQLRATFAAALGEAPDSPNVSGFVGPYVKDGTPATEQDASLFPENVWLKVEFCYSMGMP